MAVCTGIFEGPGENEYRLALWFHPLIYGLDDYSLWWLGSNIAPRLLPVDGWQRTQVPLYRGFIATGSRLPTKIKVKSLASAKRSL